MPTGGAVDKTERMADDFLCFEDEAEIVESRSAAQWTVVIIDDEQDVHSSTLLALGRSQILGRPLRFVHCYSAAHARETLATATDVAVILLDVVMESEQAGLELVQHIRETLKMTDTRIILRTGQPGYAPELDVIARYEINDYKTKSELTRNKLYTAVASAIRSYSQIRALQQSKRGLEAIIEASKGLICLRGYDEFAAGVITQLAAFFGVPEEGVVCVKCRGTGDRERFEVIAAAGAFKRFIRSPVDKLDHPDLVDAVQAAAAQRGHVFDTGHTALYFPAPDAGEMVVFLDAGVDQADDALQLLEFFSTNIAVCIDNLTTLTRLHESAYHDSLLGIPNRLAFIQRVDAELDTGTTDLVVVLIDIDHFSPLNDTIGTVQGDALLKVVAARLSDALRKQMIVARISGDTFGVLGREETLKPRAIKELFAAPFAIGDEDYLLSATQGWVRLADQASGAEVIAQANMALKRAKHTLRGGSFEFHAELLKETENRVHLLQALRHTFEQDRLSLAYQPKIDFATGQVCGIEALMRWRTNDGRDISPMEFIPIAEASGLIILLGDWALRRALQTIGRVRSVTGRDLRVAVNVSVVQFGHPYFIDMLDGAIDAVGAAPDWLELEITESLPMEDLDNFQALIENISERGVRVSIDDFGTGFSSLSYLEKLNIHALKIDKYFIERLDQDPPQTKIPAAIVRLARSMNLESVAEGVETEAQAHWLREAGCNTAQGYLFAKPLTEDEIVGWTENNLQA